MLYEPARRHNLYVMFAQVQAAPSHGIPHGIEENIAAPGNIVTDLSCRTQRMIQSDPVVLT